MSVHGGRELDRNLNRLADANAVSGWHARLSWLTRTQSRRDATVGYFGDYSRDPRRLVLSWLSYGPDQDPGFAPSKENRDRLDRLYMREHRRSRVRWLKTHLAQNGAGTVIEVHADPDIVLQSNGRVRSPRFVALTGGEWEGIVDHWTAGDEMGLAVDWEDICDRYLYPPRAYYVVDHLGFA